MHRHAYPQLTHNNISLSQYLVSNLYFKFNYLSNILLIVKFLIYLMLLPNNCFSNTKNYFNHNANSIPTLTTSFYRSHFIIPKCFLFIHRYKLSIIIYSSEISHRFCIFFFNFFQ